MLFCLCNENTSPPVSGRELAIDGSSFQLYLDMNAHDECLPSSKSWNEADQKRIKTSTFSHLIVRKEHISE